MIFAFYSALLSLINSPANPFHGAPGGSTDQSLLTILLRLLVSLILLHFALRSVDDLVAVHLTLVSKPKRAFDLASLSIVRTLKRIRATRIWSLLLLFFFLITLWFSIPLPLPVAVPLWLAFLLGEHCVRLWWLKVRKTTGDIPSDT